MRYEFADNLPGLRSDIYQELVNDGLVTQFAKFGSQRVWLPVDHCVFRGDSPICLLYDPLWRYGFNSHLPGARPGR